MPNIINKVVYDGQTLIDLTQDDVTASDVRSGVYFHDSAGVRGQGTLTSTSVPTADTIAEWDSDTHMNSEDMTSQEVDDFVDGLNVSGGGKFIKLVWENPNPTQTSTMGESTITTTETLTDYNIFLCEFRAFYNSGDKVYGLNATGLSGFFGRQMVTRTTGNPMIAYTRLWYPSDVDKMYFSDCTRITSNSANVVGQDTGCLVPLRIWGIKVGA